jgi:ubiquinone biosynthesis protein
VVRSWIEENLGPRGKIEDLGRHLSSIARFANDLPNVLIRGERLVEKLEKLAADGFDLSGPTVERIGRAEARRARLGHAALWAIVIVLALGLWLR